jgi:glycosyltransferase involved in cell wall biosynthesis
MRLTGSRTRLALFLPTLDDGGAEQVMLQLGASFRARGFDVDLVLAVPGGPLESRIPPDLRVVDLAAPRTLRALPAFARYLRRESPAALLSTLEHSNILSIAANGLARSKTRVVLREANVLLPADRVRSLRSRVQRALMHRFYPSASAIVAVSDAVARSLVSGLGIAARKIRTIYNPVVTSAIYEKAAVELDDPWFAPQAPPVVLGVGRLVPQKDFSTLLRAFAAVRKARAARLVILGEGEERSKLVSLARELGVESDVRLPGFDHNPFRYMQRSTVFALSSLYEGLPGALIQAMACGCRVISTDCPGGSREVLDGGRLGCLTPVSDPGALARGIIDLLGEAEVSKARPHHAIDRFTESATVDQYLQVLGVADV